MKTPHYEHRCDVNIFADSVRAVPSGPPGVYRAANFVALGFAFCFLSASPDKANSADNASFSVSVTDAAALGGETEET